ncbi:hypothetical protein AB7942_21960 [Neobacillus sp. BF23-41]|uniref:hypothetical protein n=1 Tax=Neobacillus sp. BF23-41 TaxID=3240280 RepID=UPI0034E388D4
MTNEEYEKRVEKGNINLNELKIVIGMVSNVPFTTGCFKEGCLWKIYMVGERQDLDIVQQGTEEEIFDVMYSITESRRKLSSI